MAFSEADKVTIRKYLGWPLYKSYDTTLESSMDFVGAVPEQQAMVTLSLASIAAIEVEMGGLPGLVSFSKVEDLTMNPERFRDLCALGRRECRTLGSYFNIVPVRDVFSSGWGGGAMPMG